MNQTNSETGEFEDAAEGYRRVFKELVDELEAVASETEELIEHHPVTATATALLLGILIGSTWSRRK